MSQQFTTRSLYHRSIAYLTRVIGLDPPVWTVKFIPDITRYFFSEAIDDRVKYLASGAVNQEESFREEVTREYGARVEHAIWQRLKVQPRPWRRSWQLETRLARIKLPASFSDHVDGTKESILEFMRVRGAFCEGRLDSHEALAAFGVFLRAIQQVALDIVRVDYPATGTGTEVPRSAEEVVRRILIRIDEFQRLVQTPAPWKSLPTAETELRVLVARAKGVACLPLRPIPTAPLSSKELAEHYVGRPDEQALRLARQIRHADGTILVTGYRGVGKSSFVNRAIYHALGAQENNPSDGWLIVPVTVNLAKVSGVQNILRITLRSLREALLEPNTRKARAIPGYLKSIPLPLSKQNEIEPLEEAYIRATYKVTMSSTNGSEKRWDLGSSFGIDPGKLLGGSIVGLELGKFLEAGIKNTKTEKINRELSLLDFDENAAEENLARLIQSLATPRSLFRGGPDVRIKLVFIFDELDKMDIDTGLKPMIEGLKNLFLQQYSVFILVTSKRFYYDLLKDRAIEDAMLNSYFSAIVHVPLLSFAQARKMVHDWVDWNATEHLKTPAPAETKLIDQLTRVLVYRSFGNPRDIIRELRLMQDWADTVGQPYLTDSLSKSPNLQIFAAIQECIEKTAVPQQTSSSMGADSDGSVTLVSDRLIGDEARLEQIRRGLYILTEELINRQTLVLEFPSIVPVENLTPVAKIQRDNFSLLSLEDVRQLAKRLGGYLSLVHDSPDLFLTKDWGTRVPLFEMSGPALKVTKEFYALTGRQAVMTTETAATETQQKTTEELIEEAENFAAQVSWAANLAAINIIKQLGSDKLTPALKKFLWSVAETDPDANHRLAAAERLPLNTVTNDEIKIISKLVSAETDERVLSIFIRLLGGASEAEARKTATDAIVKLLNAPMGARKLTESTAIEALTVLQTVASHDVTSLILVWLRVAGESEVIQTTAVSALKKNAEQFGVDVADKIISNPETLAHFLGAKFLWPFLPSLPRRNDVLHSYLLELIRVDPLAYATKLLRTIPASNVNELLTYIWSLSLEPPSQRATVFVFQQIVEWNSTNIKDRLYESLRATPGFHERILPYFPRQLPELVENKTFTLAQAEVIEEALAKLEEPIKTFPAKPKSAVDDYLESFKFRGPGLGPLPPIPWSRQPEFDPARTAKYLGVAALLFLPGFFFYKADLPAEASVGKMLASRLLLLVLALLIIYPFVNTVRWMTDSYRDPSTPPVPAAFYGLMFPLLYSVYYLHTTYIGPLHFWPQVLQLIINWPAAMAVLFAFDLYRQN